MSNVAELSLEVASERSGNVRGGTGTAVIAAPALNNEPALDDSVPESMGGRGVRSSPEELPERAACICSSAMLFGLLRRAEPPAVAE